MNNEALGTLNNPVTDYITSLEFAMKNDTDQAEEYLLKSLSKDSAFYPSWSRLAGMYYEQGLIEWSVICWVKGIKEREAIKSLSSRMSEDMQSLCRSADFELDRLSIELNNHKENISLNEDVLVNMRLQLKQGDPIANLLEKIIESHDNDFMINIGPDISLNEDDDDDDKMMIPMSYRMTQPIFIKVDTPKDDSISWLKDILRSVINLENDNELIKPQIKGIKISVASIEQRINENTKGINNELYLIKDIRESIDRIDQSITDTNAMLNLIMSEANKPNIFKRMYNSIFKKK